MRAPAAIPAGSRADAAFLPAPQLPRGGLATHGMGEHWNVNTQTGALAVSVPLAMSPGRGASKADLSLNYGGGGRSAYGHGWGLSVPSVTRRSARRLPTYTDADIFGLTGLDDLVPMLEPDGMGGWRRVHRAETIGGVPHQVQRFRPRTDDTRTRIERCTPVAGGPAFWRSTDAGNVRRTFGRTADARIADPADPSGLRVSEWLLDEVRDDLGNVAVYEYKREDTVGVKAEPGERHRLAPGAPAQANRYLKRIRYANAAPGDATTTQVLVVLDYGEHDLTPVQAQPWPARSDAYSVYTAGFEVRTYRLCRRVLIFHDFESDLGPGPSPRLVRSIELGHDTTMSRLVSVRQVGYLWTGAAYETAALPPVEFGYIDPVPAAGIAETEMVAATDGAHVRFVDLNCEGLPGILLTTPGAWWYQPPAGDGRFDPPQPVAELPPTGAAGTAGLRDVDGTGRVGVAAESDGHAGTSVRQADGTWDRYLPQASRAVTDLADPRLRRGDLTGDGRADLQTQGADALRWTESLGRDGYGLTRLIPAAAGEADGPCPPADDTAHEWFSADMSGDGLADLVRVRDGRVDYWPNLGWGRYGGRVTMTGTLAIDRPGSLDGTRIRLADLDGTGTADLVYLGDRAVLAWRNRNGTSWSAPEVLADAPRVDTAGEVQFIDLLGAGSPCLVWTSSLPGAVPRYLDLAADGPPHRLRSIVNNLGGRITVDYDTSARQQLAARRAGRPWRGTTATATVVVSRVREQDEVSQATHVTSYTYRDAWSDPVERASRGFGQAQTSDAESIGGGLDLPPVRTMEWFATGLRGDRQDGVYAADPQAPVLAGPDRVGIGTGIEFEQSARALAGRLVRSETWVDDGGPDAPVTVTQTRAAVRLLQPADAGRPAAFGVWSAESITAHYERSAGDPRVTHDLTLATDDHGTPTSAVAVAYARRVPQIDAQDQVLITWTQTDLASTDDATAHRISEITAVREYEVTGVPVPPAGRFDPAGLTAALAGTTERDYSAPVTPGLAQRRLRSATRYEFWDDTLSAPLPPGQTGVRARTRRVLRFALTPDLVASVFGAPVTPAMLTIQGGYELAGGLWWCSDGVRGYDPAACYLPASHTTAFGNTATVTWDSHHLLVTAVAASATAPLSLNATRVANDYVTLAPRQLTDAGGVRERIEADALGRVVRSWRTAPDGSGDPDPLPGATYDYGADAWQSGAGPCWSHSAVREDHGDPASPLREQRMFIDGFGRIAMTKTSCEPGQAWADDGHGGVVAVDTTPDPRWIGTGRTVFNNKGLPVEQYEPYFAVSSAFDTADALVKHAVLQRRRYDALGRLVRVDHPDGTVETVEIGPWRQVNADRNDTVLTSDWYAQRQAGGGASAAQQRAATLAAAHANTPLVQLCDGLGRITVIRTDNGPDGVQETRYVLDGAGEITQVYDARGIQAGAQLRDAAGRVVRTDSVDAGTQVALPDAAGRPLRQVTAMGHVVTCRYDLLGRPVQVSVVDPVTHAERVAEYTVYGEEHPQAVARLLVGQTHRRYHGAGLAQADRFDLGGNLVEGTRQLLAGPAPADWTALVGLPLAGLGAAAAPLLDGEIFASAGTFDALGRALTQQYADGTAMTLDYAGGEVTAVTGLLPGAGGPLTFVTGIGYDARRRRTGISYGNGVTVAHDYDEHSGRPGSLSARAGNLVIQDLTYTYDPVGNVVQVSDGAAQSTFFAGAVVAPGALYTFDPAYRLRTVAGREHSSLGAQPNQAEPALPALPHPNDVGALRSYTETYSYDAVGNLTEFAHASPTSSWTRRYDYTPDTNRLAAHELPGDPAGGPYSAAFDYDAGGNTVRAPNIASLSWDHAGRCVGADLGGGGTVTYTYDGSGTRARKIWQRNGNLREERIYLGELELFRRYLSGQLVFERRTLRVLDGKRVVALVETVTVDTGHPGFDATPHSRYQIGDLLGSSAIECDDAGVVISYEEYHPFGTTALWLARDAAAVSTKRYRYTGKEKDEETGFYALGARYYCCWLGRWLSPDPAGLIDGVNRYAYAGNNPVSRVDPSGLAGKSSWDPQLWLSEAKSFWLDARATQSTRGFTKGMKQYFEDVFESLGGPEERDIGHMEDPFVIQAPGTISKVGIQSAPYNRSAGATADKATAAAARAKGDPVRVDGDWQGPAVKLKGKPPKAPTFQPISPKPLTVGGQTAPVPPAGAAAPAWKPPAAGPSPGPSGEQLKLPGVQTEYQPSLPFDAPSLPKGPPPVQATAGGGPQQLELFAPPAANPTTATADVVKAADATKDAPVATKAVTGTTSTAVTTAADTAKPALGTGGTLTPDATAVSQVTTDTTKAAGATQDIAQTGSVVQDASNAAALTKDASELPKVTSLAQDARALADATKAVTPAAKTLTPVIEEAGALTKLVTTVSKVATPVVKVVTPVVRVVGEVAKPLAVGVAAVDLATANNNSDRLVATGDLAAGVSMYCGPVGEAFGAGYTVGGLADKGIEVGSKAAFGVDLSPSNGIAHNLDGQDRLISSVIPDDPAKPAYKNENKIAWFLIDTLGF